MNAARALRLAAAADDDDRLVSADAGDSPRALRGRTHAIGARAARVGVGQRRDAALDERIVNARRRAPRGRRRGGVIELGRDRRAPLHERVAQRGDLARLLRREREPSLQLLVEPRLMREIDGHMQQRAARRDPQPLAERVAHRREPRERTVEIVAPHVAAVDDAAREHLVGRIVRDERVELRVGAHEIDVQARDGQRLEQRRVLARVVEIRRDEQLRRAGRERFVRRPRRVAPRVGQIEREDRLVDLHPVDARFPQPREQRAIRGHEARQQREALDEPVARLA